MTAEEFASNLDDGQLEYADSFHASLDAALAADRAAAQQVASVRGDEAGDVEALAEKVRALRLLLDEECPHGPEDHAEGTCELCDYVFAADAVVDEWAEALTTWLAARDAEQRRLGREEGAGAVVAAVGGRSSVRPTGSEHFRHGYSLGTDDAIDAARAAAQQVSNQPRDVSEAAHRDGDCNCPSCRRYALVNEAAALGARRGWQEGFAAGKQYGHDLNDSRVRPETPANPYADPSAGPCCLRCEAVIYQDDEGVWRRETTGSEFCPHNPAMDGHEPRPAAAQQVSER